MKIPSLVRLPKHKKFDIEPRYYDPIVEDIKNRTALIEQELKQEKADLKSSKIKGSFIKSSTENDKRRTLVQLVVILGLTLMFTGYFFLGNKIIYAFIPYLLIYIWWRQRNINK